MKKIITIIILMIIRLFSFTPSKTLLVSDEWFTNLNYTLEDVTRSIKRYPNNKLSDKDIECIYWVAKVKFKINYEAILLAAEKETRIISNPYKTKEEYNKYYNIALCVGLNRYKIVDGKKIMIYYGFRRQVYHGARVLRKWFDAYTEGVQKKLLCTGEIIEPENASTYAFFMYTPYYSNNIDNGVMVAGNKILPLILKRMVN